MPALLAVRNLSKVFTLQILRGKRVTAFQAIDLDVAAGGFVGLLGPSGAGKSSLLKTIYRTYLPSSGSIAYCAAAGRTVDLATADEQTLLGLRRREIGYVAQFLRAQPRVPALDVVAAPAIGAGVSAREARARAASLLQRLRMPPDLWDSYPVLFSGGEQQRINVARALITRPRLLLLDEPTSALDEENTATVTELLREAKAAGTTMIGIFHDPAIVRELCDQVVVLSNGHAVAP